MRMALGGKIFVFLVVSIFESTMIDTLSLFETIHVQNRNENLSS
jgi:hypothetical protein